MQGVLEDDFAGVTALREIFLAKTDSGRLRLNLLERNFVKLAKNQIALLPPGLAMLSNA
ncbi:hypothetical protein EDC27_1222 [Desulfosoma caldarium]|uniref:Uncharacterized protein n=1 Tax=Desulfosoma caldarium TaxID=610254 RepID=A0A3N1UQ03_9BACT|nr:hypothetical protein EDC27_1222 [Desulfosoma caldarium]